jgi:hypothetical protein
MGFVVGDLIDQATDEEIRAGAQVARHVRVGLHVLASEVGAVAQAPTVLAAPDGALDCGSPGACGEFKRAWAEFHRLKATKAFPMPAPATHRGRR